MLRTAPHVLQGENQPGSGFMGKQEALAWEGKVGWKGGWNLVGG